MVGEEICVTARQVWVTAVTVMMNYEVGLLWLNSSSSTALALYRDLLSAVESCFFVYLCILILKLFSRLFIDMMKSRSNDSDAALNVRYWFGPDLGSAWLPTVDKGYRCRSLMLIKVVKVSVVWDGCCGCCCWCYRASFFKVQAISQGPYLSNMFERWLKSETFA